MMTRKKKLGVFFFSLSANRPALTASIESLALTAMLAMALFTWPKGVDVHSQFSNMAVSIWGKVRHLLQKADFLVRL
jgi:hypothetical protein